MDELQAKIDEITGIIRTFYADNENRINDDLRDYTQEIYKIYTLVCDIRHKLEVQDALN